MAFQERALAKTKAHTFDVAENEPRAKMNTAFLMAESLYSARFRICRKRVE